MILQTVDQDNNRLTDADSTLLQQSNPHFRARSVDVVTNNHQPTVMLLQRHYQQYRSSTGRDDNEQITVICNCIWIRWIKAHNVKRKANQSTQAGALRLQPVVPELQWRQSRNNLTRNNVDGAAGNFIKQVG